MRFEGIHHVTCITGDAPGNVDFYTGVLGLRLVKKTVNQDDPTVYHLFYADEQGSPGADITFFEYPGARRGRAGAGMVHTITFRLGSLEALDFWQERLAGAGVATQRDGQRLRFDDPEGLGLELAVVETGDAPLVAHHPEIPGEYALQGFDGVRAFAEDPSASAELFDLLPVNVQRSIFPDDAGERAMGITGFTLPTLYRWVTSDAGRAASLYPFRKGHYLGSGPGEQVLAEAATLQLVGGFPQQAALFLAVEAPGGLDEVLATAQVGADGGVLQHRHVLVEAHMLEAAAHAQLGDRTRTELLDALAHEADFAFGGGIDT